MFFFESAVISKIILLQNIKTQLKILILKFLNKHIKYKNLLTKHGGMLDHLRAHLLYMHMTQHP